MKLDAFIDKFYDPDSQAGEKSLYAQRGFMSGAYEGWFNADGADGSQDPKLDSQGNAFVDITAHVGDYLVDVHEYSAGTPNITAAKALLLKQVQALKSDS